MTSEHHRFERVQPDDLMQLALDVAPLPMHVGAVLVLDGTDLDPGIIGAVVGERAGSVPRLGQRLATTPLGCGGPVWLNTPVDLTRHLRQIPCPAGDDDAVLAAAIRSFTEPLPSDRPLWRADVISGGGRTAVVVTMHHVLADGTGGLALLARLADGPGNAPSRRSPPSASPGRRALAADAWRARFAGVARAARALRSLRPAMRELGAGRTPRATRCSLNRPVGRGLHVAAARTDLAEVRRFAHDHGGTVNDAALAVVTGALGSLLTRRGETVDRLVVSVPVSGRALADGRLGNRVGVMPVALPTGGDLAWRTARVAEITRARKTAGRGGSAALVGPTFRVLRRVGLLRPLLVRQRLVNTFVTNVRGPDQQLSIAGAPVVDIWPLSTVAGNSTVAFTVFSYAGTLRITVQADPVGCPDVDVLVRLLQEELDGAGADQQKTETTGT